MIYDCWSKEYLYQHHMEMKSIENWWHRGGRRIWDNHTTIKNARWHSVFFGTVWKTWSKIKIPTLIKRWKFRNCFIRSKPFNGKIWWLHWYDKPLLDCLVDPAFQCWNYRLMKSKAILNMILLLLLRLRQRSAISGCTRIALTFMMRYQAITPHHV